MNAMVLSLCAIVVISVSAHAEKLNPQHDFIACADSHIPSIPMSFTSVFYERSKNELGNSASSGRDKLSRVTAESMTGKYLTVSGLGAGPTQVVFDLNRGRATEVSSDGRVRNYNICRSFSAYSRADFSNWIIRIR